jgi:hypothetical protein
MKYSRTWAIMKYSRRPDMSTIVVVRGPAVRAGSSLSCEGRQTRG